MKMISISRKNVIPECHDYKRIRNFGNIHKYRLLQKAHNNRYCVETYAGENGFWVVFVDKKDYYEPLPFMYQSYAAKWTKYSTACMEFRNICREYGLDNRVSTKWYHICAKEE